ncbi:MAG: type II secretion system F family protein [Lachnospiraceae bacterium]|nr:type II secretion system F family protein [Lachnospiraceae bacterium]
MPAYKYTSINRAGKQIKGTVEAKTMDAAMLVLKGRGEIPIDMKEETVLSKDIELPFFSKIPSRAYSVFCWQLKSILAAGVTIVPALEMMAQQTENKKLRAAVARVKVDVEKGESFSDALARQKDVFPPVFINMMAAGEASGNLETSLERMAVHFEKDGKLKSIVRNAMIYPIILIIVIIAVMVVILTYVIPSFTDTFDELGIELPLVTRMVLSFSNFFVQNWLIILITVVLLAVAITLFRRTDRGRHCFAWLSMKLPLFGDLTVKSASAMYARTLSTLMGAGIPVLDSLEITAENMSNVYFQEATYQVREDTAQGRRMGESLERTGLFPLMLCHMMSIGEETGEIEDMLQRVADYYDEEVENATKALTSAMEPAIIVVMGLVVGTLVMAIFMPIMSIYNGMDQYM